MEKARHKISSPQFFVMMFVSRVVVTIALNARFLGGETMLDSIVSYVLAMALGFLIALPVWLLQKRCPGKNVGEAAQSLWGRTGKLVPALYILYFILVNGASLGLFQIFLLDTVNPEFSSALTIAAILAVALYGAFRGIETVARCAACVFVILLAGVGLVFSIVAFRFDPENLEPLFVNGFSQTLQGVLLFTARTSIFADMAVLLPMVKGRKLRGFAWWAAGTAAFVSLLLLLLQGCLGRYAATQNFPVYTLSSITEVRSMQRLDAVFVGIWMTGLIIKLACDGYACRVCFSSISGKRQPGLSVVLWGLAVLLLAFSTAGNQLVQGILLNTGLLFCCTIFTGFLLPLFVLAGDGLKHRKGGEDL